MVPDTPHRLRRKEAADYVTRMWGVQCAPSSLAKYVTMGGGSLFQKLGKFAVYDVADLDSWARGKMSPKAASSTEMQALERANAPA